MLDLRHLFDDLRDPAITFNTADERTFRKLVDDLDLAAIDIRIHLDCLENAAEGAGDYAGEPHGIAGYPELLDIAVVLESWVNILQARLIDHDVASLALGRAA